MKYVNKYNNANSNKDTNNNEICDAKHWSVYLFFHRRSLDTWIFINSKNMLLELVKFAKYYA